jgi:hypothetical protein
MANVTFIAADKVLTEEQKRAISGWYDKVVTNPPVMPIIPKKDVTSYVEKKRQEMWRISLAGQDMIRQSLGIFRGEECDRVLKMRKDCDLRIWLRVNFHWRRAVGNWVKFGLNLWMDKEGIPKLAKRRTR